MPLILLPVIGEHGETGEAGDAMEEGEAILAMSIFDGAISYYTVDKSFNCKFITDLVMPYFFSLKFILGSIFNVLSDSSWVVFDAK